MLNFFRSWSGSHLLASRPLLRLRLLPKASPVARLVKNHLQCRRPQFDSWVRKIPWRRDRLPIPVFLHFPGGSAGKESACNAGDLGSISGLGRSPGEGNGYPLQYSGLENSMDCIVNGLAKSRTRLSDFHFHFEIAATTVASFLCICPHVSVQRGKMRERKRDGEML